MCAPARGELWAEALRNLGWAPAPVSSLPHSFAEASVGWALTVGRALGCRVRGRCWPRAYGPGGERWVVYRAKAGPEQQELQACGLRGVLGWGMSS